MHRIVVIKHDRRWPRPANCFDERKCPVCAATVHDKDGQARHLAWHQDLDELVGNIQELISWVENRLGIDPKEAAELPWHSATADELEEAQ